MSVYKKIIEIMNKINSSINFQNLLSIIIDSAKDLLNAEGASLLLLDESQEELIFNIVISDKGEIIKGNRLRVGEGIAGEVAKTSKGIIVNDVSSDDRFCSDIDKNSGFKTKDVIALPVVMKDKLIGVLEVVNSINKKGFSDNDLELLEYIADAAAVAINNHELMISLTNRVAELTCIYDISQSIYFTFDIEDFLSRILTAVNEVIKAEKCSFVILDDSLKEVKYFISTSGEKHKIDLDNSLISHVVKSGDPMLVYDIENDTKCTRLKKITSTYSSKSFLCVPMKLRDRIIGVLNVTDKPKGEIFDSFDLRVLSTVANHVAETYENVLLQKMNYEKTILDQEISIAAEIQGHSFTHLPKDIPGAIAGGFTLPSSAVGGDFFDVIIFDDNNFSGAVGDVSGKGVPAAIFMNSVRNSLRFESGNHRDPDKILPSVNKWAFRESHNAMFCTFFYFLVDRRNRMLRYASAGHNSQLFYDRNKDEFIDLITRGKPLGIIEDENYEVGIQQFSEGDFLILFTDGMVDEESEKEMTLDELKNYIRENNEKDARVLAGEIEKIICERSAGRGLEDDSTLLLVKFI